MTDQEILTLIQSAVASPHGVEIETNNTDAFKGRFYVLRKKFGFTDLRLLTGLKPNTLWIVPNANDKSNS